MEYERESGLTRGLQILLTALLLCVVMALAALVRIAPPSNMMITEHMASYTDKDGLPYFSQHDAYYHIRMGDEIAETGSFGTPDAETGERMDMLRYAPEGKSAAYHAGIVYAAVYLHRFLNRYITVSLHTVEYYLSCLFAALTAFAAFLLAARISNAAGGLFAAVFTACAPAFATRTAAGSFDTDMVQLLLTMLLMLLMVETLLARSHLVAFGMASGTALVTAVFTLCWTAGCLLFTVIMFAGGAVGLVFLFIEGMGRRRAARESFLRQPGVLGYAASAVLTVLLLIAVQGPSYLGGVLADYRKVNGAAGLLPNLMESINELQPVSFWPQYTEQWFRGFGPGPVSVISGIGGIAVFVLAVAGVILLAAKAVPEHRMLKERTGRAGYPDGGNRPLICLAVIGLWFAACLYGVRFGRRFMEHLAAPAGILAGCAAGWIAASLWRQFRGTGSTQRSAGTSSGRAAAAFGMLIPFGLSLFAALFTVYSAWEACSRVAPSANDAEENAMDWIAANAGSEDAVVVSWWDMGYFYEYESGHPVLWDGEMNGDGQTAMRAMTLAKALTTDDMKQSRNLLLMLSTTGDAAAEMLTEAYGPERGFDLLWTNAELDADGTRMVLRDGVGMEDEKAKKIAETMHPDDPRETYLVLTMSMMRRLGLYEYYADWDFSGTQEKPLSTSYQSHPDGSGQLDLEDDTDPDTARRKKETIWRLFLDRDGVEDELMIRFERVYEVTDGVEQVQVWRVLPGVVAYMPWLEEDNNQRTDS